MIACCWARLACSLLLAAASALPAQEAPGGGTPAAAYLEREGWRLEFDNDLFFFSDSGISSGLSLQRHSSAAKCWDDVKGVPGFIRRLGRRLPFPKGKDMVHRSSLAIGQLIQTPTDLTRKELIREDVPYAGALLLQAGWYAYSDREFRGFQAAAGVAGPLSLAAASHRGIHRLFDFVRPEGWKNQLGNEPLLNLYVMGKRKFWRGGRREGAAFDLTVGGDAALGNLITQASLALELRAGRNLPGGFASPPDAIGFSMHHNAVLSPARSGKTSLQGFLVLRLSALARSLFLDGSTFRDSHHVQRHAIFSQLQAGLRCDRGWWGIGLFATLATPVVKAEQAPAADVSERVGTIHLELRF